MRPLRQVRARIYISFPHPSPPSRMGRLRRGKLASRAGRLNDPPTGLGRIRPDPWT